MKQTDWPEFQSYIPHLHHKYPVKVPMNIIKVLFIKKYKLNNYQNLIILDYELFY